jgi:excisionase family DNA binding protein
MVQYYTLEQAAQILRTTAEKVREMVRQGKLRGFQDRGTLRFRAQEVDELARSLGLGSEQELQLGEGPQQKGSSASSGSRKKSGTYNLVEDENVPLGQNPTPTPAENKTSKNPPSAKSTRKTSGLRSPPPRAASDSDVRLVSDNLDFSIEPTDAPPPSKAPSAGKSPTPGKSPSPGKSSTPGKASSRSSASKMAKPDSDVRGDSRKPASDSDVKLVAHDPLDSAVPLGLSGSKADSDSEIRVESDPRLEHGAHSDPGRHDPLVTEEIDLDEEERKAQKQAPGSKMRPGSSGQQPVLPTSSPFELSESDLGLPDEEKKDEDFNLELLEEDAAKRPPKESDSDDEEEVVLGGPVGGAASDSGINLQDPADSGISLEEEKGSEEIEFELSLDVNATPKPQPANLEQEGSSEFELTLQEDEANKTDSSSEFELSLEEEEGGEGAADSSSEFELTLDEDDSSTEQPAAAAEKKEDSDSEFELTLDEEGGLAPLEEEAPAAGGDKDIFEETDFDVPALEDESASEAVSLEDTEASEVESSEFELDISDEDAPSEEESESQAVALDDEDTGVALDDGEGAAAPDEEDAGVSLDEDEPAPPPKKKSKLDKKPVSGEEEGLDIELDDIGTGPRGEEEEEEEEELVGAGAGRQAEWGVVPLICLLPTMIILFIVGLMSFELLQGMWGYHKPAKVSAMIVDPLARQFDEKLPKQE